jgi:hypothetical protein
MLHDGHVVIVVYRRKHRVVEWFRGSLVAPWVVIKAIFLLGPSSGKLQVGVGPLGVT